MTREDIIRLAQEAGGRIEHIGTNIAWFEFLPKNLERFAALVAAAERERICQLLGVLPITNSDLKLIRDVIRGEGEK